MLEVQGGEMLTPDEEETKYSLCPDDCVQIGGHCYDPIMHLCKHCGETLQEEQ